MFYLVAFFSLICYTANNERELMPATSNSFEFPLKVKRGTKFQKFLDWYGLAYQSTNPDTGRKRKGNVKAFILDEFETILSTGKASSNLLEVADEFKNSGALSPELQKAKANLSETDFLQLVALMEKAGT